MGVLYISVGASGMCLSVRCVCLLYMLCMCLEGSLCMCHVFVYVFFYCVCFMRVVVCVFLVCFLLVGVSCVCAYAVCVDNVW